MKLSSPVFEDNQMIPSIYTCDGENVSPPLLISEVPNNAQSLALIMDDPDAATDPDGPGKTFDHWCVWNISPQSRMIDEGMIPTEAEDGLNGAGRVGYTGP